LSVSESESGVTLVCPKCQQQFPLSAAEHSAPASETTGGDLETFSAGELKMLRGDAALAPPPALPAVELPGYEILGPLGKGGMGQVYKARHLRLDRLVALKMIRPELLHEPSAVARFHREAQAAARLSHPHIVGVYDATEHAGRHWLVMEYVEGDDLASVLRREGSLPVAQACSYVQQAALGLEHARQRGLVHRDIKPGNLLVTADRTNLKILDLGLARVVQDWDSRQAASEFTQSGVILGTPAYLAPEQALDSRSADTRSDVYSLGCTLYHLLTGRVPFPGESLTAIVVKHQTKEPDSLASLRRDLPAGLEAVVRKMMAKRPEDRFQTPGEVAAALAPFASSGEHATTLPVSPARRPVPPSRRLRGALIGAAVVGLAVVAATLVVRSRNGSVSDPSQSAANRVQSEQLEALIAQAKTLETKSEKTVSDYRAIVDAYSHALEFDPRNPSLYCSRGFAYYNLTQYEDAIADYEDGLRLDPTPFHRYWLHWYLAGAFHNRAAFVSGSEADWKRAAEEYTTAMDVRPEAVPFNAYSFLNRAICRGQAGDRAGAIADFTRQLQSDPKHLGARLKRARLYEQQGDLALAKADREEALRINAQEAIRIDPDLANLTATLASTPARPSSDRPAPVILDDHLKEGLRHFESLRFYLAANHYTEALKLDPDNAEAYNQRGWANLYTKEFARAVDDFTQLIRVNDKAPTINGHALRAMAFVGLQQYDQAIDDLTKAIAANDDHAARYYIQRADLYRKKGDQEKEAADREQARKLNSSRRTVNVGDHPLPIGQNNVPFFRALQHYNAGQYDDALIFCNEALKNEKYRPAALNLRGLIYLATGNEGAVVDFTELIGMRDKSPGVKNAWIQRALAHAALGDLEKAIDDFSQAIAVSPANVGILHGRAEVYLRSGAYDKSIGDRKRADELGQGSLTTSDADILPETRRETAMTHYRQGLAAFQAQRYDEAVKSLDEAVRFDPEPPAFFCLRGAVQAHRGEYDAAVQDFTELIRRTLPPAMLNGYSLRGYANVLKGDYPEAIADLSEALEIVGGHPLYLRWRAEAYERSGQAALAQADRQKYQAAPGGAVALQIRSLLSVTRPVGPHIGRYIESRRLASAGQIDEAIAAATEAIELYPDFGAAYNHRGYQRNLKRDYNGAIADFTELIRCNADVPGISGWDTRGNVYLAKGDHARALADFTRAIEENPLNTGLYLTRARAYEAGGDVVKASADRAIAARLFVDPAKAAISRRGEPAASEQPSTQSGGASERRSRATALRAEGADLLQNGQRSQAIAKLTEAIDLEPGDAHAYSLRGVAYASSQKFDLAIADYTEALRLNPEDDAALFNRSAAYATQMKHQEALTDANELLRRAPSARAYSHRGWLHLQTGALTAAIDDYTESIRLDPTDSHPYLRRAETYEKLGDTAKAQLDREAAEKLSSSTSTAPE
jgi:tetratricopeptide (TPR) repeat protein